MTKVKIILISFLIILIALISVLFGAVFRVRNQVVVCVGEDKQYCENLKDEILESSGIKNGNSTFMLNKQDAISNIEKTHPYIKVVQIKTTSVTSIEIKVKKRYEMFYSVVNGKNYVLDEDLKVLRISDIAPTAILFNETKLAITNNTEIADFVGTNYHQQISASLVEGLWTHARLERDEMISAISSISFENGYSLNEAYTRLILATNSGVKIDICKPEVNLAEKLNICFSTLNDDEFTEQQKSEGTIKIYLDKDGNQQVGYFKPAE